MSPDISKESSSLCHDHFTQKSLACSKVINMKKRLNVNERLVHFLCHFIVLLNFPLAWCFGFDNKYKYFQQLICFFVLHFKCFPRCLMVFRVS